MSKNRLLLLFSNHRVAEKLWPIIPRLSQAYTLDLFLIGLFSKETPWVGDLDEREVKVNQYKEYIDKIIYGPGVKFHGDNITKQLSSYLDLDSYDAVIFDDNRAVPEFNMPQFYNECKEKGIKVVGNSHGNEDNPHNAIGVSHDIQIDFKTGGIPANDTLKYMARNQKHILVIANFLGNRHSIYPVNFDRNFVIESGILDMSIEYNLPIKVKIKTRLDNPDYSQSINYVKQLLECDVIANTDNIDQLIADSAVVLSAPSTLAFKPIQLGLPTILIEGCGAIGDFKDYEGLVKLNKQSIFDNLQKQIGEDIHSRFIEHTIAGGNSFTSTEFYIKRLTDILW
jgi:hypothetical protein